MGTHQQLTYEQVEVLEVLRDLEDLISDYYDTQQEKIDAFSWDSLDLKQSDEELIKYIDMLKYFKYVNPDGTVTYDGLQYLLLYRQRERIKMEIDSTKEGGSEKPQIAININYVKEQHNAPLSHANFNFNFEAELNGIKAVLNNASDGELPNVKNIILKTLDKLISAVTNKQE